MTTNDKIYEYLKTNGPADHKTLATKLRVKEPSIRRSCQQLFAAHKIEDGGSEHGHKLWKIKTAESDTVVKKTHQPPDKPGWTPGNETDKEARRAEIAERARLLQGGPKLF